MFLYQIFFLIQKAAQAAFYIIICIHILLVPLYLAIDFIEHIFYYYKERLFDLAE